MIHSIQCASVLAYKYEWVINIQVYNSIRVWSDA